MYGYILALYKRCMGIPPPFLLLKHLKINISFLPTARKWILIFDKKLLTTEEMIV